MSNLLASLRSSATTLESLQRSVAIVQNNVSNVSTPGYVKQRVGLTALDFSPEGGLSGGVATSDTVSARDRFAEAAVRSQASLLGAAEQSKTVLSGLETALDLNDASGVPAALNQFYTAVTSWGLAPSSLSEKENVVAAANNLAVSFNRAADGLQRAATEAQEELRTSLAGVDAIAERIRLYNVERMQGGPADAGADARLHADLEELSGLMNVQTLWQDNGTVTILAGGRSPLVSGDHSFTLSASFTTPFAGAALQDAAGVDISDSFTGGNVGALLSFLNNTVPEYIGGGSEGGKLDQLASTIAARVNTILGAGYPALQEPNQLFIYGSGPASIAQTLKVNPSVEPIMLNATDSSVDPPVVNGKALQLAGLAHPSQADDMIEGTSYVGFFGRLSAKAGRDVAETTKEATSRQQLLSQARSLREQVSGVSLDEEAIRMVEFQRAYQATARMVAALDEITKMTVNLGRV
jgi:flagellar hook-associated protein 1